MDLNLFTGGPLHIDETWLSGNRQVIESTLRNLHIQDIATIRNSFAERLKKNNGETRLLTGSDEVQFIGNTAIVPIKGVISKELDFWSYIFGGTSTDMLRHATKVLASMGNIKNVLLDVNSPGGSVSGLVLAADAMRDLRRKKNVVAFSNTLNASAAFQISSASNGIFVTPGSRTGSFGTLAIIANQAERLKNEGWQVEIIRAGEFKAKPNSIEAFTEKDREIMQEGVDKHYNDFVSTVAKNLRISEKEALEMANGLVYDGENAIKAGFAKGVGSIEDAIEALQSSNTPVTISNVMNKWEHIFKDSREDQPTSTDKLNNDLPMSENNTQNGIDLAAIQQQIASMQTALEGATSLIESQAAIIKDHGFKSVDSENTALVNTLVEEQKVKARFRNSLPAFMALVARSGEKFTYHNGEETVEVQAVAFVREFLQSLTPMVPTSKKTKDTDNTPANNESTDDIIAAAVALQQQYAATGRTLDTTEAVAMVAKQTAGVA